MPSSTPDYTQMPHLSNEQQSLLRAALSSNQRNNKNNSMSELDQKSKANTSTSSAATSLESIDYSSLTENTFPSSNTTGMIIFEDPLFPDYNDSNTSFDIDFSLKEDDFHDEYQTFGDNEPGDKRKNPDDDQSDEEYDSKRREGDDKVAKKPGRKLITAEPTTKRKAQNRAAQRAFRERKEKHVKDLEQKVSELEKVTDNTTQENGLLRAQIDRLQTELRDYRKRLSLNGNGLGVSPPTTGLASYATSNTWNSATSDFQFDFSRFGETSDKNTNGRVPALESETSQSSSNGAGRDSSSKNSRGASMSSDSLIGNSSNIQTVDDFSWLTPGNMDSGVYPELINNTNYGFTNFQSPTELSNGGAAGTSNAPNSNRQQSYSTSCASNTNSPAASSTAHTGSLSSCGTSPEPLPGYTNDQSKTMPNDSLGTSKSYEDPNILAQNTSAYDFSSIDWLSNQNGGQFDPVLFGDYREPQGAIVGDGDFTSGFFDNLGDLNNDPFDFGLTTTTNPVALTTEIHSTTVPPMVQAPKKTACQTLMEKVDKCRNGETGDEPINFSKAEMITTHKLWTELQSCPKFISGEFDIDTLCSELSAKATCSESGMSVPKAIVEKVLWRLAGVPDGGDKNVADQVKENQWEAMRSNGQKKSSGH